MCFRPIVRTAGLEPLHLRSLPADECERGKLFRWDSLATCEFCTRGILASFVDARRHFPRRTRLIQTGVTDGAKNNFSIAGLSTGAPEDTPARAANYYRQGMENLPNNYDAAGSMFRSALEAGLKVKFPDIDGTLYERIKKAAAQQGLTFLTWLIGRIRYGSMATTRYMATRNSRRRTWSVFTPSPSWSLCTCSPCPACWRRPGTNRRMAADLT